MQAHQSFFHRFVILLQIRSHRGNQAFKASPAGASVEKFQLPHNSFYLFSGKIKHHAHQPAGPCHLLLCQFVLGMCLPPGINHFFYNRKLLEIGRHLHGICHMLLHTYRKSTYPAQHQPGIKRAHDSAEQFPFALGDLIYILFAANHHTADNITVPAQIFGRGMHHHIDA